MLKVRIWFSASDKTCCLRRPITLAGTTAVASNLFSGIERRTPDRIARRSGIA